MDRYQYLVAGAVLVLAAIGGYVTVTGFDTGQPTDSTNGVGDENLTVLGNRTAPSGAVIETVRTPSNETYERIRYTRDGRTFAAPYRTPLEDSFAWLRNNTPQDAVITAWWDYGHSIRGYTGRDVFAYNPSRWVWEQTTTAGQNGAAWDAADKGGLASRSRMRDLATVYTTSNATDAARIMESRDSVYLYVTAADLGKYAAMARTRQQAATAQAISQLQCIPPSNGVRNRCAVDTVNGTRYLGYRTADGRRVFVPIASSDRGVRITGPARIETGTGTVYVPRACTSDGMVRFNVSSDAQTRPGCFAFHPDYGAQRFLYIPRDAMDALLVRLYVMDGAGITAFEPEYSKGTVQIWKISTATLARVGQGE